MVLVQPIKTREARCFDVTLSEIVPSAKNAAEFVTIPNLMRNDVADFDEV